ncbi:MAG: hypothetical protein COB17_11330, partial [Sulfurimonas sp.]
MKKIKLLIVLLILNTFVCASEEVPKQEEVSKLYVATFNRASDSAGLDYWTNNSGLKLSQIAQSFFEQNETKELYPDGTSNTDFITSVYQNLFNRAPDTAGLNYWENELSIGSFTKNSFIQAVINGAQDNDTSKDVTILNNKNSIGLSFAQAGLNDITDAKTIMSGITNDTATVEYAKGKISNSNINSDIWKEYLGESIIHMGVEYYTVTSPYTGTVWLDRNLGASQTCTAIDDEKCYGDYYQWGRGVDGHEKTTSLSTSEQATDIDNAGPIFITASSTLDTDWAQEADSDGSLRSENWSEKDGTSVCPIGFRVPTVDELGLETLFSKDGMNNNTDAFNNFLKLPSSGQRSWFNNEVQKKATDGYIWTNSIDGAESKHIQFNSTEAYRTKDFRATGKPIRCMKPTNIPPTAVSKSISLKEGIATNIILNGSDEDGDNLTYEIISNPTNGILTGNDENRTYTPSNGYVGEDSFIFKVSDGINSSTPATITITITEAEKIVFKGKEYRSIISPYTEAIWLDRNMGASRACAALDDEECYGDYYQWGRSPDGHEKLTSPITDKQATSVSNIFGSFITSTDTNDGDWAQSTDSDGSLRSENWSKKDGTSVCPKGYRV